MTFKTANRPGGVTSNPYITTIAPLAVDFLAGELPDDHAFEIDTAKPEATKRQLSEAGRHHGVTVRSRIVGNTVVFWLVELIVRNKS